MNRMTSSISFASPSHSLSSTTDPLVTVCGGDTTRCSDSGVTCTQFQEICCTQSNNPRPCIVNPMYPYESEPRRIENCCGSGCAQGSADVAAERYCQAIGYEATTESESALSDMGVRNICDDTEACSGPGVCQQLSRVCCSKCGNNIVDQYEQCDDGNQNNTDGCRNTCVTPKCGDGIQDPGEECDDGNENDRDGCRNACVLPKCGDGIKDPGEECDDGGNVDGDGCEWNCKEPRSININRIKEYRTLISGKEAIACALAKFREKDTCGSVVEG